MYSSKKHLVNYLTLLLGVGLAASTQAQMVNFYVGKDSAETLGHGIYSGLPNPNQGRLSLLYAHVNLENFRSNHYHGIGSWSYTGDPEDPTVAETNSNDHIPETYTGQPPLTLVPGSGIYEGKWISAKTEEHYSDLTIQSVHNMLVDETPDGPVEFGYGSPQHSMFHSSGGTRSEALDGVIVAIELVEKSPELHFGSAEEMDLLTQPGDRLVLGDGNDFSFTPVIWANEDTPEGHYYIRFKIVDVGEGEGHEALLDSGVATFDFQVPGEPELTIFSRVLLTMPMITDGYVLQTAPTPEGPWTNVEMDPYTPSGDPAEGVSSGYLKALNLPADMAGAYFRLVMMESDS